jgi:hypothetical protein
METNFIRVGEMDWGGGDLSRISLTKIGKFSTFPTSFLIGFTWPHGWNFPILLNIFYILGYSFSFPLKYSFFLFKSKHHDYTSIEKIQKYAIRNFASKSNRMKLGCEIISYCLISNILNITILVKLFGVHA